MKLLLDTHTFLWLDHASDNLPQRVKDLCQNPENELLLSLVSIWEMQIKFQLGKLRLQAPLEKMIADQQSQNGLTLLPITLVHIIDLQNLPMSHRDPFDRLLISQARLEGATLLSKDEIFATYPVTLLWN
jgi:PIN domain nuclease of toxin-antitoxin system